MTRDTGRARLPALPPVNAADPALRNWISAVNERLEVREGSRGNLAERVVTWRDLQGLGVDIGSLSLGLRPRSVGGPAVAVVGPDAVARLVDSSEFERAIFESRLFQSLIKRLDDPSRFDALPEEVRRVLLNDIAVEAKRRGAEIQRLESKIQTATESLAYKVEEVTAAVDGSSAGVRELAYAAATEARASAGKITQVQARLDDVGGVTIEESITAIADVTDGLRGEYFVKINAGRAVAGFGLAASEDPSGNTSSDFIVQADKLALVPTYTFAQTTTPSATAIGQTWYDTSSKLSYRATSTGTSGWTLFTPTVPFGVDTTTGTTFINGQVLINAGGRTLDQVGKSLTLSASAEVFKTDQAGAITPSSITLTASLNGGITGTVTWSASPSVTLDGTGNSRTLTSANMGTNTAVSVTASVTSGGATFSDTFTVYRLTDGSDALTGLLTNEAHTVPASSDGAVSSFAGASGSFLVYRGSTLLSSGVSYSIQSNPSALTASINSSTGSYSVTGAGSWASGSTTTTLTLRATIGTTTIDKVFTITKSAQGATGATGATGEPGLDGARGSLTGFGSSYDIRSAQWNSGLASRVVNNLLTGETLKTELSTTTHLRIGDTVTLGWTSPWVETLGTYDNARAYARGNIVLYSSGGVLRAYLAIVDTTGNLPTDTDFWTVYAEPLVDRSGWAASVDYEANEVVTGLNAADVPTSWIARFKHTSRDTFAKERDGKGFSETRYWGGSEWLRPGVVIDGNLLVNGTISGDKIAANAITAAKIKAGSITVDRLSSSDTNLDIANVGSFRLGGSSLISQFSGVIQASVPTGVNRCAITGSNVTADFPAIAGSAFGSGFGVGAYAWNQTTKLAQFLGGHVNYGGMAELLTAGKQVFLATADYSIYSPSGKGKHYIADGAGPFTGFHDGITHDAPEIGDICVDHAILERVDVSNVSAEYRVSTAPNQRGVIGVCSEVFDEPPIGWESVPAGARVIHVNALGEGLVNVCGEGGDIALGDLIVTSSRPGKGMRQADDLVRSTTVAKVREPVRFDGDEVRQVACVYLCG